MWFGSGCFLQTHQTVAAVVGTLNFSMILSWQNPVNDKLKLTDSLFPHYFVESAPVKIQNYCV